jgi:putative transposase
MLSFVIQTDPAVDAQRFPPAGREVGIDLGLAAFAVLSDGTKVSAPRFLRRAEKKLRRLQGVHSRKQKGSRNQEKSRVRLARVHAAVANRRANFCHQASTMIIRENQAVYVEDLCAARNVLALGRRESLNACGGGIRPGETLAAASEPGSHSGTA